MQLTIDRVDRVSISGTDERAARRALRGQIAKLERELAEIVVSGFPHIAPPACAGVRSGAACLLDLERLERTRDELAGKVQMARRATAERAELETRSRELLERMKLEPARYKFVRLPVRDLGEHGCGVWEVRPRLGLVGMLAGWWQVKLSSGCPLGWGSRESVAPGREGLDRSWGSRESVAPGREGLDFKLQSAGEGPQQPRGPERSHRQPGLECVQIA
jgi:hypothetical protein